MVDYIGLDFETYGAVDLPTHGLDRYVSDKSFTPLLACVAYPSGVSRVFDFTEDFEHTVEQLRNVFALKMVCAHNAGFEQRVLAAIGIDLPSDRFVDSAVVARAAGAGSRLEAAAPQLLGIDKMESGVNLIKLFSLPGWLQEENGTPWFDSKIKELNPHAWQEFTDYCVLDAQLSLRLVQTFGDYLTAEEHEFMAVTMDMNRTGWCVDVPVVEEMQRRYLENQEQALFEFRFHHDADELNLNSLPQMKAWCQELGVKATSFDEKNVAKLLDRVSSKLEDPNLADTKRAQYTAVKNLLVTKQILGGSSLKKLQVILDTATMQPDGTYRLRDQYLHAGAGQSLRTSGRSVQMQNLKRLSEPANMSELNDPGSDWDNTKLAENLRQVFTASHPQGRLVVGDFSSVESRGLAYLAGEEWKLDSYRQGKDLYKVLASKIYSVPYDQVTKVQRQTGKVGELSCGYQAGPTAVVSFAEGMGVPMTESEATVLVRDWRDANPAIVELWDKLDDGLRLALLQARASVRLAHGMYALIEQRPTPRSLLDQHPGAQTLMLTLLTEQGQVFLRRTFNGCYQRSRNVCYYKPSDRKTGDLWASHYTDPKTKQVRFYDLYGGKLAGILTQSFCREIFFRSLVQVCDWAENYDNVRVVGQFHDEIVLDWSPGAVDLDDTKQALAAFMSNPGPISRFPLDADVKDDYRYTK